MLNQVLSSKIADIILTLPKDKESVALIRNDEWVQLKNYSTHPGMLSFDGRQCQKGDILFHTHCGNDPAELSDEDIKTSLILKIPLLLYHTEFHQWDYFDPCGNHPYPLKVVDIENITIQDYIRLKYSHLRCNCYTLARNIARQFFAIDYPEINFHTHNSYKSFLHPEQLGFKQRLDQIQNGDLLYIYVSPEIPYHTGIVFDTEKMFGIHILSNETPSKFFSIEQLKYNIKSVWCI